MQKCVLKVNIHCDGCKHKVKKILQKIDGVFTTDIDAEQGKVTVTGNVDPAVLIKKLAKSGKHADLWGAPKANNNNQNNMANQFKNMQIDNGKGGNNKGAKGGNNQPKGGQPPNPQQQQQQQQHLQQLQLQQQLQQLQQLQQMKGFQGMNLPQFKDMKLPAKDQAPSQKTVKFDLPEDDDDFDYDDDEFDDEDFEDDDFEDEFDDPHHPLNKMKSMMGNGQKPNIMMMNGMMNGNNPQLMNAQKGGNVAGNAKKGGGGAVPIQVNGMGGGNNEGKNGNGGKKGGGGGGGGNNQNQGGGGKNGGKNGGGVPQDAKNCNGGGGANNNKNVPHGGNNGGGANGNHSNGNVGKKIVGDGVHHPMNNNGLHNMGGPHPHAMAGGNHMGHHMANMNIPMGNMPMGQMGNIPAVQGLPAAAMNGGGAAAYFQGAGPEPMPGNPMMQQQYLNQLMQQQRGMGNERFQPMMYSRQPPPMNYMAAPYQYQQPHPDPQYAHFFSDENTSSCNVM
ncbi:hypothetical protein FH972_015585 [Carpinus fangiana]|uniref:HMA domain-containing protein n=1 Tax=Carpinus fangiana TaxID=176857 RepID=A0A5N6RGU0_9ROSI|nr:hypothetical protein FH972_015585 [Carpinus fangiana]